MTRSLLVVSAFTLLVLSHSSADADWPEFRGPDQQGHAPNIGLPVEWNADKNVEWKTAIPGLGWSSPIVLDGRIYLTTAVSDAGFRDPNQSLRALCLDAKDGVVLWDIEVFKQSSEGASVDRIHTKNSQASPTPITDGQHIFVHFGTRGTACLTPDGDVVWKTRELKYQPVHGNGGSPILVGNQLIIACDGGDVEYLAALNKSTGQILWKQDRTADHLKKKFSFTTPLLIEVNGQSQIISQGTGAVYAYRPDGSVIWKADYGDGYSIIPRPVYAHGLVYVGSGYDRAKLLAIDPTGEGDVTETHVKWIMTKGAPHTPSPLVVGDELYVVSDKGILTCLDAVSGEEIWQERLGGNFSASPLSANGLIYLQSENGESIVFRPGRTYQEVARNRLENDDVRTFASYAVIDSSFLIRSETSLFRITVAR
ncbi:PQQ-binding-like beta-propeller repeat protein [bacterium]|nr:PQQ-binding-like beta-propeller repeat protein [bacterium]